MTGNVGLSRGRSLESRCPSSRNYRPAMRPERGGRAVLSTPPVAIQPAARHSRSFCRIARTTGRKGLPNVPTISAVTLRARFGLPERRSIRIARGLTGDVSPPGGIQRLMFRLPWRPSRPQIASPGQMSKSTSAEMQRGLKATSRQRGWRVKLRTLPCALPELVWPRRLRRGPLLPKGLPGNPG